jgi:hypothetical protein
MASKEEKIKKLIKDMLEPEYWKELVPFLEINGRVGAQVEEDSIMKRSSLEDIKYEQLIEEGYCHQEGVFPEELMGKLSKAIQILYDNNINPVFGLVFDEIWLLARHCCKMVERVLGEEVWLLPASWIWYVEPSSTSSGWRPHRERSGEALFDSNGIPQCLSVWLPINDALPINGCMYVVPINKDPFFPERLNVKKVQDLQSIRALPAKRGDFLCWNQAIMHWGGSSSSYAPFPRVSICFEMQRKKGEALQRPTIDPFCKMSLSRRLFIVGLEILNYKHMSNLDEEFLEFAKLLCKETINDQPIPSKRNQKDNMAIF